MLLLLNTRPKPFCYRYGSNAVTSSCTHNSLSVVLIDDDDEHRDLLTRAISSAFAGDARDINVITFRDPELGLAELPADEQTVILIDYSLDGTTGTEWLADFVRTQVGPVILITSHGDEMIARKAFNFGASDYLVKQDVIINPDLLRRSVGESLRRFRLEATNRTLATRLKRSNAELERKNERLAELTSIAHRFVDDVAHEFRTPLAVIKEFASILSDGIGGDVTDNQQNYLSFISTSARDLAELVDDFLDSSKLRSQSLRVDRQRVSVSEMVDSVWPLLESRAGARSVTLRLEVADNLPAVFADSEKAGRCLINLVVNAVKFSSAGGSVTIRADLKHTNEVTISVHDEGPGLPPDDLSRLFDRFHQTGSASMIETKGFGLGLSIVQQLVALNLGEVRVTSTYGEGSTFSYTLPVFETGSVVDAILSHAASDDSASYIAVLAVTASADADLGEFADEASRNCYASNVLWRSVSPGKYLLIGTTKHAEAWRARVLNLLGQRQTDETAHTTAQTSPAGEITVLG